MNPLNTRDVKFQYTGKVSPPGNVFLVKKQLLEIVLDWDKKCGNTLPRAWVVYNRMAEKDARYRLKWGWGKPRGGRTNSGCAESRQLAPDFSDDWLGSGGGGGN
jgi:hypothetical protein